MDIYNLARMVYFCDKRHPGMLIYKRLEWQKI